MYIQRADNQAILTFHVRCQTFYILQMDTVCSERWSSLSWEIHKALITLVHLTPVVLYCNMLHNFINSGCIKNVYIAIITAILFLILLNVTIYSHNIISFVFTANSEESCFLWILEQTSARFESGRTGGRTVTEHLRIPLQQPVTRTKLTVITLKQFKKNNIY